MCQEYYLNLFLINNKMIRYKLKHPTSATLLLNIILRLINILIIKNP